MTSNSPKNDSDLTDSKPSRGRPNKPSAASAAEASRPRIGDSRPAPAKLESSGPTDQKAQDDGPNKRRRRRQNGQGGQRTDASSSSRPQANSQTKKNQKQVSQKSNRSRQASNKQANNNRHNSKKQSSQKDRARKRTQPVSHVLADGPVELDEKQLKRRRGRSRKGRPVGRYMMVVSRREESTHIAVVEGRQLVEYTVSRPSDDITQIHGNIYLGRVQNVLPGMEAAFVDIGTPKNAVLYRSDVTAPGLKSKGRGNAGGPKIEELLKPRQTVLCQVTKNPIAHKGARLTMEVSLPGRFVVLVPNSDTYGISKRLPDGERKRLRQILDRIRPKGHGLIVRTAAENVTAEEIERDVFGLCQQWEEIDKLAKKTQKAALLYREPDLSTRVIREEFNKEYRAVIIDNEPLYNEIAEYVSVITPALAERVEHYDASREPLSVFERYHVHEQLHKALDRKVWLPSGGSLIIEATEALTVIDVNTGKNVGSSSLEETVFRNNLEAAEEVAHQLRLRDIGGIIVIDFVDMEDRKNREEVMRVFRKTLARDKTRTQVFGISDLGLVEMTRKRIGEGLVESLSGLCSVCEGRGLQINEGLIDRLLH